METVVMFLWYLLAISAGVLTKEFVHFNKHQKYYSRGAKTIREQINNYMKKRWDNLAMGLPMGVLLAFLFHSAVNTEAATNFLLEKLGMESMSLKVSSYAMVAFMSAFGDWIGVKIGLIKKDEIED